MICPECQKAFDHRASSHQGPECDACMEARMLSIAIDGGTEDKGPPAPSDLIDREAAVAAANCVAHDLHVMPGLKCTICETARRVTEAIRALPAVAPWAEEVVCEGEYKSDFGMVESETAALAMFNPSPGRNAARHLDGKRVQVVLREVKP